jgi:hypothetical protein
MTAYKLQPRPLITVGVVSGLAQILAGILLYVSGAYFAAWSGLMSRLVLGLCIAAGTRWYVTRVLGGRSTYMTAMLVGLAITVSTAFLYAAYNVISVTFVYPNFLEELAQALGTRMTLGAVVANNIRGFIVVGTILSALIALAFRKKHRTPQNPSRLPAAPRA